VLKLALSEDGLIQLYELFDNAEQRSERLRCELVEKGDLEAAAVQAKRRDDFGEMKRRILEQLRVRRKPPSRLERFIRLLRAMWPYYPPQRP